MLSLLRGSFAEAVNYGSSDGSGYGYGNVYGYGYGYGCGYGYGYGDGYGDGYSCSGDVTDPAKAGFEVFLTTHSEVSRD